MPLREIAETWPVSVATSRSFAADFPLDAPILCSAVHDTVHYTTLYALPQLHAVTVRLGVFPTLLVLAALSRDGYSPGSIRALVLHNSPWLKVYHDESPTLRTIRESFTGESLE